MRKDSYNPYSCVFQNKEKSPLYRKNLAHKRECSMCFLMLLIDYDLRLIDWIISKRKVFKPRHHWLVIGSTNRLYVLQK